MDEFSDYQYIIKFSPGQENLPAAALSRLCSATSRPDSLEKIPKSLCHPGITRLFHHIKLKNLSYSLNDVKSVGFQCPVCTKFKPRCFRPPASHLIHALYPYDRVTIDFIRPKPSLSCNKYLLVMIDEHSVFPFIYPCPGMSAQTVIKFFHNLFSVFGFPSSIYSVRRLQFISKEVSHYLMNLRVVMTHSTLYHQQGNVQCKKENGTIWSVVRMTPKSRGRLESQWEFVLDTVFHSIKSLLCTVINRMPNEKFFSYPRKTFNGYSSPTLLSQAGTDLVQKYVYLSKSDPVVEQMELISTIPQYAWKCSLDGQEALVFTKDLAPAVMESHQQLEVLFKPQDTSPNENSSLTLHLTSF